MGDGARRLELERVLKELAALLAQAQGNGFLRVEKVALLCDVTPGTVRAWEAAGDFGEGNSVSLPGGDLRIRRSAVEAFLDLAAERRELERVRNGEKGRRAIEARGAKGKRVLGLPAAAEGMERSAVA